MEFFPISQKYRKNIANTLLEGFKIFKNIAKISQKYRKNIAKTLVRARYVNTMFSKIILLF